MPKDWQKMRQEMRTIAHNATDDSEIILEFFGKVGGLVKEDGHDIRREVTEWVEIIRKDHWGIANWLIGTMSVIAQHVPLEIHHTPCLVQTSSDRSVDDTTTETLPTHSRVNLPGPPWINFPDEGPSKKTSHQKAIDKQGDMYSGG